VIFDLAMQWFIDTVLRISAEVSEKWGEASWFDVRVKDICVNFRHALAGYRTNAGTALTDEILSLERAHSRQPDRKEMCSRRPACDSLRMGWLDIGMKRTDG
jgi:hypothetical protein